MTATDGAARPPSTDVLRRHALRVAIAEGRAKQAGLAAQSVRSAAEIVFAEARKTGTPQQRVRLPDGSEVGLVSIHKGSTTYRVNEDDLEAVALKNDADDFEDYLLPGADRDADVIALIAEHFPDRVGTRLRPPIRERYQKELEEHDGQVVNRTNGEYERVAEVTPHDPTGRFTYTPGDKAWLALEEALRLGHLTEDGEFADPDADAAEAAETAVETSAEPIAEDSPPE